MQRLTLRLAALVVAGTLLTGLPTEGSGESLVGSSGPGRGVATLLALTILGVAAADALRRR